MRIVIEPERFKKFVHASLIFDGGKATVDNVKAIVKNGQLVVRDMSKPTFGVDSVYDKSYFIELDAKEGESLVIHSKMLTFLDEFMSYERITVRTDVDKLYIQDPTVKTIMETPLVSATDSPFPIKMEQTTYGLLPEKLQPVYRAYFDTETLNAIKKSPKYTFACDGGGLKVTVTDDTGTTKMERELTAKAGPEPPVVNKFNLFFGEGPLKAMISNLEGEVWVHFSNAGVEAVILTSKRKEYLRSYMLAASAET